jgi:hypothetical protein
MLFELSFQFDMKIKMASTLCTHYHRKCQIKVSSFNSLILDIENMYLLLFQTSCCNEVFGCLQCHNEIQSHKAKLKDIKALICLNCKYQHDGITNICVQCDTKFGEVRILFPLLLILVVFWFKKATVYKNCIQPQMKCSSNSADIQT